MKHLLPLFMCALFCSALLAAPEAPQAEKKASRTISVSGCAIGYIQPDAVLWTVSPQATGKTLAEAREACEQQVKALLDGCSKKGVQGNDVSLGMVNVQDALSGRAESPQDRPERFAVSRTLTLRQRELHLFQEMLSYLGRGTGKVSYKLYCARVDKITRDTLLRATQAAKDKAGAMANVLGATLGPVLSVSEYAPTNTTIKQENVIVDDNSPVYGADAEKINITVFATFELQ